MYKIELSEEELKWLTRNWKTRVLLQESATKIAWSDTNRASNDTYVQEAILLERLRSVSPEDKDDECDSFGTAEVFRRTLARMKAEDAKLKADYEDLANSADEIRKAYNAEVEHRMYATMEPIPPYEEFVDSAQDRAANVVRLDSVNRERIIERFRRAVLAKNAHEKRYGKNPRAAMRGASEREIGLYDMGYDEATIRLSEEFLTFIDIDCNDNYEQDVPSKETQHRFEGYIYNGIVVCAAEHKIGDVPPDYFKNFFLSEEMGDKNGRVMLIQCVGYNGSMPGLRVERIKKFKRKAKKF